MTLFKGLDRAYGTYRLDGSSKYDGKKVGGKALTVRAAVTEQLWADHLAGVCGLGIIPIRDDSHCYFGLIDIDVYPLDLREVAQKIHDLKLPILPCRSKSGGVHGYVFLSEPVHAKLLVAKLKEYHAALAYGDPKKRETFPKQTEMISDRDVGNWANSPYFGGEDSDRYGIKLDGSRMTIEEFFAAAEALKQTPQSLKQATAYSDEFADGPPCIQMLAKMGFTQGSRNDCLCGLSTYYRKAKPATWKEDTREANQRYMQPPMDHNEVESVINSMGKKEYNYPCSKVPFSEVCQNSLCKKRKHGVSQTTNTPVLTSLTKYNSEPPVWFAEIEGGGRMELTTDALQNQTLFQKRCMEVLHSMPPTLGKNEWMTMITQLLEKVHVVEAPAEASPKGQLIELLEQFCTSRAQASTKEEIVTGKKTFLEDGRHCFRLKAFKDFLKQQNFRALEDNLIASTLQERGGSSHQTSIKGRSVRYWSFPEFHAQKDGFEVPKYESVKEPF